MIKGSGVFIVSYDCNGTDEAVLLVLEKRYDAEKIQEFFDLKSTFKGQQASDLYGILSGMEE